MTYPDHILDRWHRKGQRRLGSPGWTPPGTKRSRRSAETPKDDSTPTIQTTPHNSWWHLNWRQAVDSTTTIPASQTWGSVFNQPSLGWSSVVMPPTVTLTSGVTDNSSSTITIYPTPVYPTTSFVYHPTTNFNFPNLTDNSFTFAQPAPPPNPVDVKRDQIRKQLAPTFLNHKGREMRAARQFGPAPNDFDRVTQPEMVALSLLKSMLPSDEWRRYLKHGIVVVRSPHTGLVYQVVRNRSHIVVARNGVKVAELCIYLKDNRVPPTDSVIAKMVMLECSEADVWKQANIHGCSRFWSAAKPSEEELRRVAA